MGIQTRYTVQDAHIAKQEKNMKYKKGTFIVVPNQQALAGKPSELQAIYIWLCSYADKDGRCFPARRTLAKNAGCNIKTLDKYLNMLIDEGFIAKETRKIAGSEENLSNSYQLLLVDYDAIVNGGSTENGTIVYQKRNTPSTKNGATPSTENGAVTKSNNNSIHLTDTTNVNVVEQKRLLGQLPDRLGKNAITRLGAIYRALWRKKYGTECTSINYGKFGKIIKMLLQNNTEAQITALLLTYFNWSGASDDNANEYKYLSDKGFPIELLPSKRDIFVAYLTNNRGVCYDNLQEVEGYVARNLKNIL